MPVFRDHTSGPPARITSARSRDNTAWLSSIRIGVIAQLAVSYFNLDNADALAIRGIGLLIPETETAFSSTTWCSAHLVQLCVTAVCLPHLHHEAWQLMAHNCRTGHLLLRPLSVAKRTPRTIAVTAANGPNGRRSRQPPLNHRAGTIIISMQANPSLILYPQLELPQAGVWIVMV
jgi:hypothetical protein